MALLTNQSEILPGDSFWDVSEQVNPGITFLNSFRGLSGNITTSPTTLYSFTYTPDENGKIVFSGSLTVKNVSTSQTANITTTFETASMLSLLPVRGTGATAEKSIPINYVISVGVGTGKPLGTPFTINYNIISNSAVTGLNYGDASGFFYFSR